MEVTENLGFALVDLDRVRRRGHAEAIYCPGKLPHEVVAIAQSLVSGGAYNVLATRVPDDTMDALTSHFPDAEVHQRARLVVIRPAAPVTMAGHIAVLSWRIEDLAVAEEVVVVARAMGSYVSLHTDIPLDAPETLPSWVNGLGRPQVLVVVDGSGAALASVVAGLVRQLVISVPTTNSNSGSGIPAVLSSLVSCVPGVVTVNADNGFGAAYAAHVVNHPADLAVSVHES